MRTSTWNENDLKPETVITAAALSVVPGLGQLYNGEARKGILYLCASLSTFMLISVVCLKGFLISGAKYLGSHLHVKLNSAVMDCLCNIDLRSPQMLILALLMIAFTLFSVRDAFERRVFLRREKLYAHEALAISEAASGSYVIHALAFGCMLLLVLFLFVPPQPKKQICEIDFELPQTVESKPVETKTRSSKNSKDSGRVTHRQSNDAASSQATQQTQRTTTPPRQEPKQPAKPSEAAKPVENAKPAEPKPPTPPKEPATRSQSKASPSHDEPAPAPPKPPTPPVATQRATAPQPLLPAPLPATAKTQAASAPLPQITNAAKPTITGVPQPLIASALPSTAIGAPIPLATNSSARPTGAPNPMSASTSGSHGQGVAPAAPSIMRDTGSKGTDGVPQPMPASSPHHRASSPGGDDTAPPAPRAAAPGPSRNIQILTPVTGTGPAHGTGVSPTRDIDDKTASKSTVKAPDFGEYMEKLQRRIRRAWIPPKSLASRRVVVLFKIHRNGEMSNLRLVSSSGAADSDQSALRAINDAAPFFPLPDGADDDIDVQFTFDYNLYVGRSGTSNAHF
ncbi:MAG TPA: TonB family protein [Oculatellaceae cyanobacterium]